jgi:nucleoside-diphosphate-sugar epimerase
MFTILGAGGAIGNELAAILAARNAPYRLVGRSPKPGAGAEAVAADLADRDQTIRAVSGPPAHASCSKKGGIRARIATTLMDEVKAGRLTAMIARSADFYGPPTKNGVPNVLVFEALAKGSKPGWLVNDSVPHSLTFTPDAARGVAMLADRDSAWNQVWHLPTAPDPPTGRQFIEMAAAEFGKPPKYRVLSRPLLRIAGWFNPTVRESYEMLYQNDAPYLFDSNKFAREFGFAGTSYPEGIRLAAASYK